MEVQKVPYFSVIVPIYNVEKYLNQCIDSVLAQTCKDYELILVDDGSPDGSGAICDQYARKYQNVKVIHKENGGLSDARNYGIDVAEGEYITFIDSDDWWSDDNFLKKAKEILQKEKTDIYMHACSRYFESKNISVPNREYPIFGTYEFSDAIEKIVKAESLYVSAWSKIIIREKIQKFDSNLRSQEDIEWILRQFKGLRTVYISRDIQYQYRQRDDSLSKQPDWRITFEIIKRGMELIDDYEKKSKLKEIMMGYLGFQYGVLMRMVGGIKDKKEREYAISVIEPYQFLLERAQGKKTRICKTLCRLVGLNLTCVLLARHTGR